MAKLALALLCAAFALVAARQLHQTAFSELPQELQALNARLMSAASKFSATKASTMSLLHDDYDYDKVAKEVKYRYDTKDGYKYDPKYEKEQHYEYESKDKYYELKEEHKGKYEKEPKYDDEYYASYDAPKHYYGPNKVAIKLYEKFRSKLRPQETNANTFQFTSELTCQNPAEKELEHADGLIGFPIVSDRMKLVTVGLCEWTVTLVKEQKVTEHAKLKGNTNVVCTFLEEAERHCKHAEDVLCEGMSVSGQGLVYNFESESLKGTYEKEAKLAEKKTKKADEEDEYKKEEEEDKEESMDIFLSLINGVVNANKHMKWDNGAVQYFFGKPVDTETKARDASVASKKGDPTGEYTFLFKH